MSENTNQEVVTDLDSSFFQAYSKKVTEDSKKSSGGGSYTPKQYDDIAFGGLETGVNKIFRLIGAPPGAESMGYKRKDYDPKQIMMCEVKDDEGKKFTIKLPLREDIPAHNHILHRLWDKVAETAWINKKKVFINEAKHPELWLALTKGNYKPEDGYGYSIAGGYKSTTYTLMNVIDRADDWCKENKHTKLIARDIGVSTNSKGETTYWPKPGVKSFGFLKRIADIIGKYGNYETYDLAIKRTGDKDNPFELKNASLYKSKDMMDELKNADGTLPDANTIVVGPLSAEEKTYMRYDLDKLYQPTSYTKLLKRIPALFKLTDATLGTKFYDELEGLSKKEKEEWERLYGDENAKAETAQVAAETVAINEAVAETPKPRRTVVGPTETGLSADKIKTLHGWSKLTDANKALIKDVLIKNDEASEIIYEECDETKALYACDCNASSPESFNSCPKCGADFTDSE